MSSRRPPGGRGLRAALASVVLGILLVAGSAYALRGPILEAYYLKKLASAERLEREAAARELARRRSRRAAEPILRLYLEETRPQASFDRHRDPWPKQNPYLGPLHALGDLAIPALWNARKAEYAGGRPFRGFTVCGVLGESLERVSGAEIDSDPRLRAAILEALGDPADEVRCGAARAIARTTQLPPEAVPLLRNLLEDGWSGVRRAAEEALRRAPSS